MCIYTHVGCIIYAALSRVVVYMRAPVYMYEESCAHVFVCICAMHIYIYIYMHIHVHVCITPPIYVSLLIYRIYK